MDQILTSLTDTIRDRLSSAGVFHLILSRKKSLSSVEKKVKSKGSSYYGQDKKIQDLYGIRVVLYFTSDINIAMNIVRKLYTEIDESMTVDDLGLETFGVARNNHVFVIPNNAKAISYPEYSELIDNTFEVQFRTIFTEGILEIEHDFRYKFKDAWKENGELIRVLNSIIASLETTEWAIDHVIEELCYSAYKQNDWESLLRNKLKIRINGILSSDMRKILNTNHLLMKEIFKMRRDELLKLLDTHFERIPLTYDNVIYVLNYKKFKNPEILDILPIAIKWELDVA